MQARLPDPGDPMTFVRCKLNHDERAENSHVFNLHRDLLRLRREEPAFARQERGRVDGEILGPEAFVLRFFGQRPEDDRLLMVNLGRDVHLNPAPAPLLAPPAGSKWELQWTSEDARYGGWGAPPLESDDNWTMQGEAAMILRPK
jgi:maltooligosyltrehalose trehalohydrolase